MVFADYSFDCVWFAFGFRFGHGVFISLPFARVLGICPFSVRHKIKDSKPIQHFSKNSDFLNRKHFKTHRLYQTSNISDKIFIC